jgi:hypothetical protein
LPADGLARPNYVSSLPDRCLFGGSAADVVHVIAVIRAAVAVAEAEIVPGGNTADAGAGS